MTVYRCRRCAAPLTYCDGKTRVPHPTCSTDEPERSA